LAFYKNKKKPKELKKGQKLQIWPQKRQTGNPATSQSRLTERSHIRNKLPENAASEKYAKQMPSGFTHFYCH